MIRIFLRGLPVSPATRDSSFASSVKVCLMKEYPGKLWLAESIKDIKSITTPPRVRRFQPLHGCLHAVIAQKISRVF